jgi:hypothetical protein
VLKAGLGFHTYDYAPTSSPPALAFWASRDSVWVEENGADALAAFPIGIDPSALRGARRGDGGQPHQVAAEPVRSNGHV